MMYLFLAFFFIWLPCGFFAASVAGDKNHNSVAWFLAGLFFGPIGVIAAAGLSDRTQRRYLRLLVEHKGINLKEPIKAQKTPSMYANKGVTLKQKIMNELKR